MARCALSLRMSCPTYALFAHTTGKLRTRAQCQRPHLDGTNYLPCTAHRVLHSDETSAHTANKSLTCCLCCHTCYPCNHLFCHQCHMRNHAANKLSLARPAPEPKRPTDSTLPIYHGGNRVQQVVEHCMPKDAFTATLPPLPSLPTCGTCA